MFVRAWSRVPWGRLRRCRDIRGIDVRDIDIRSEFRHLFVVGVLVIPEWFVEFVVVDLIVLFG
jgi:hypothetical protein